jgi:DNA primase
MPAIKSACLRDLKTRVNLLEVVSRVITVRKVGARFRGLCPFHQEKTPSFYVNPDNGFYKCFGCGKAGDAITFVRETEGLTFIEAVETLAKRFGVPLEYEAGAGPSQEERSLRQELFDLHELAAEHFHQVFRGAGATGEFMRAYWTGKRRFPLELADEFKIGATDERGSGLADVLIKRKFSEDALRQCGLFFAPREDGPLMLGSLRHRFRGRLMIPIRDHQGRVTAFTARQTELTPADDPAHEAKYVNSPETPIFTKGNILFNLDRARANVGEGRPFIMVEGQLDALRCWHVGLTTTVAPQGTAITDTQLGLLRRYHPQIECFLDGDSAGQKAATRLLPLALRAGLEVKFLVLQPGEDPDSVFRDRSLAAYEEIRARAFRDGVCLSDTPPGTCHRLAGAEVPRRSIHLRNRESERVRGGAHGIHGRMRRLHAPAARLPAARFCGIRAPPGPDRSSSRVRQPWPHHPRPEQPPARGRFVALMPPFRVAGQAVGSGSVGSRLDRLGCAVGPDLVALSHRVRTRRLARPRSSR